MQEVFQKKGEIATRGEGERFGILVVGGQSDGLLLKSGSKGTRVPEKQRRREQD